jgi:hypothetical protein
MANEIRLRSNNISGTTTDNPLTNVATTINSPGFVDLPTVDTTSHLILILDPLELAGPAEIVTVTAHSVAASVVTVVRGAEGSAARTHSSGTTWFHGPVASDFNLAFTSTNLVGTAPYAQTTSNQVGIGASADITNLTVTINTPANRRLMISSAIQILTVTNSAGYYGVIRENGVTELGRTGIIPGNVVGERDRFGVPVIVNNPTAGSHNYRVSVVRFAGTGTASIEHAAQDPGFILVEDIGPAT